MCNPICDAKLANCIQIFSYQIKGNFFRFAMLGHGLEFCGISFVKMKNLPLQN